jgi:hypothetical protein
MLPSGDRFRGRSVVRSASLALLVLPLATSSSPSSRAASLLLSPFFLMVAFQDYQWLWPQKLQIEGCFESKRDNQPLKWNWCHLSPA